QHDAAVCARDFDDVVEQRFEQLVDGRRPNEPLAELIELSETRDFGERPLAVPRRGRGLELAEHAASELRPSGRQPIAVAPPSPALALSVYRNLRGAVELFDLEIASVERNLGVVLEDAAIGNVNVVAEGPADGRDGLVDRE